MLTLRETEGRTAILVPRTLAVIDNIGGKAESDGRYSALHAELRVNEPLLRKNLEQQEAATRTQWTNQMKIALSRVRRGKTMLDAVKGLKALADALTHHEREAALEQLIATAQRSHTTKLLLLNERQDMSRRRPHSSTSATSPSISCPPTTAVSCEVMLQDEKPLVVGSVLALRRQRAKARTASAGFQREGQGSTLDAAARRSGLGHRLPPLLMSTCAADRAPPLEEPGQTTRSPTLSSLTSNEQKVLELHEERSMMVRVHEVDRSALGLQSTGFISHLTWEMNEAFRQLRRLEVVQKEQLVILERAKADATVRLHAELHATLLFQRIGRGFTDRALSMDQANKERVLLRRLMRVCRSFIQRKQFGCQMSDQMLVNRKNYSAAKIQSYWKMTQQRGVYLDQKVQVLATMVIARCCKQWVEEVRRRQVLTVNRLAEAQWNLRWCLSDIRAQEVQERAVVVVDRGQSIERLYALFTKGVSAIERILIVNRFMEQAEEGTRVIQPFPTVIRSASLAAVALTSADEKRRASSARRGGNRPSSSHVIVQTTDSRRRRQLILAKLELQESLDRYRVEIEGMSKLTFFESWHQRFVYSHRTLPLPQDTRTTIGGTPDSPHHPIPHPSPTTATMVLPRCSSGHSEDGWDSYWRRNSNIAYAQLPPVEGSPKEKGKSVGELMQEEEARKIAAAAEALKRKQEQEVAAAELALLSIGSSVPVSDAGLEDGRREAERLVQKHEEEEQRRREMVYSSTVLLQNHLRHSAAVTKADRLRSALRGRKMHLDFVAGIIQAAGRGLIVRRSSSLEGGRGKSK